MCIFVCIARADPHQLALNITCLIKQNDDDVDDDNHEDDATLSIVIIGQYRWIFHAGFFTRR